MKHPNVMALACRQAAKTSNKAATYRHQTARTSGKKGPTKRKSSKRHETSKSSNEARPGRKSSFARKACPTDPRGTGCNSRSCSGAAPIPKYCCELLLLLLSARAWRWMCSFDNSVHMVSKSKFLSTGAVGTDCDEERPLAGTKC